MEAWEKVSVENHDLSKELKRLKRDLDDTCATLDEQKRQNKSLQDENQNLGKSCIISVCKSTILYFVSSTTEFILDFNEFFSQTVFRVVEVGRKCRKGQTQCLPRA